MQEFEKILYQNNFLILRCERDKAIAISAHSITATVYHASDEFKLDFFVPGSKFLLTTNLMSPFSDAASFKRVVDRFTQVANCTKWSLQVGPVAPILEDLREQDATK